MAYVGRKPMKPTTRLQLTAWSQSASMTFCSRQNGRLKMNGLGRPLPTSTFMRQRPSSGFSKLRLLTGLANVFLLELTLMLPCQPLPRGVHLPMDFVLFFDVRLRFALLDASIPLTCLLPLGSILVTVLLVTFRCRLHLVMVL